MYKRNECILYQKLAQKMLLHSFTANERKNLIKLHPPKIEKQASRNERIFLI